MKNRAKQQIEGQEEVDYQTHLHESAHDKPARPHVRCDNVANPGRGLHVGGIANDLRENRRGWGDHGLGRMQGTNAN